MIQFNSVKSAVNFAMATQTFDSKNTDELNRIDKLIASALLSVFLYSLGQKDDSTLGNMRNLASGYASSFKSSAVGLKGHYTAYKDIVNVMKRYGIYDFMRMSQQEMNEFYDIYCNRKEISVFNTKYFLVSMYGLSSTTDVGEIRLRNIHKNILVPIVKYYSSLSVTPLVISVENYYDDLPGRAVKLLIDGVPSSRIASDIGSNRINITNHIYKYNLLNDGSILIEAK